MEWMWNATAAWFGWNIIAPLAAIILVLVVALPALYISNLLRTAKQRRCSHERMRETQACDAVCDDCDKNFGFIGTWRENNPGVRIQHN